LSHVLKVNENKSDIARSLEIEQANFMNNNLEEIKVEESMRGHY
jgi:hypothetical protein